MDDALTTPTDLVRPRWRYTYDENGNQLSQTDPRGKVTSFAYDEQGRRISRTLPPDSDGNTANDTETWTYDVRGRVDVHTDFKGQSTKYVYETDARYGGRLIEQQRFTGAVDTTPDEKTAWAYDALGRGTSVTESANLDLDDLTPLQVTRTETTGYDPLTGAVAMTASPEGVVRHTYDPGTGRLTATWTAPDTTSVTDLATARTNAHTLTEFEYNYLGQLWKVKAVRMNGATVPTASQATTHTYDSVGNLSTLALPNGITTTYTYDVLNRLDTLFARRGTTVVFSQDYTLSNDGQRIAVDETREGSSTVRTDWTYDRLNRLTSETYNSSDNTKDYKHTFAFDLSGNRRTKAVDLGINGTTDETITSAYTDRDQLTAEDSTINANDVTLAYDANGSMTSKGADAYGWDLRNRMKSGTIGGVITAYGYDTAGQRVSQQTGSGAVTVYVNDKGNPTRYPQIIEEKAGGIPGRSYTIGSFVLGQSDAPGSPIYFLRDGHGSNRGLINASGVVTAPLEYQAFGEAIGFDPKLSGTIHMFGGDAEYDAVTGNYYHDARWRWAHLFTSFDSFEADSGSPADMHKYVFARNNPLNGIDPSGKFTLTESIAVGGVAGALVGFVGGYSYGVYRTGELFSIDNLKYALVGTVIGAALGASIGGGAYIAVNGGGAALGQIIRVGFRDLLLKASAIHSTSSGAALAGFALGLFSGILDPSLPVTAGSAIATAELILSDSVIRGAISRNKLMVALGIASRAELRALFVTGQSATFLSIAFAFGFTAGYAVGSSIRWYVLDPSGITDETNNV